MGWSSGSRVMNGIIIAVSKHVPDKEARKAIYQPIIDMLDEQDWDTHDECLGSDAAYDELYAERYPEDLDDEDAA